MIINNEKELGEALKSNADTIEIEGDLANKVLRIKATGKIAWAVAIGAIGVAAAFALGTGGAGTPASGVVSLGAISALGFTETLSAIAIAVAAGGVAALNSLRKYKVQKKSPGRILLSRE